MSKELLTELRHKKEVYKRQKQGQGTQDEYRDCRVQEDFVTVTQDSLPSPSKYVEAQVHLIVTVTWDSLLPPSSAHILARVPT